MNKIAKVIIIIVLIILIGLGVAEVHHLITKPKNNTNNEISSNNEVTEESGKSITDDYKKLEEFYLPLFIASTRDGEEQSVINSYIYELNLQQEDKSKYEKYQNDDSVSLYSKSEVEEIAQELLAENSNHIIQSMDFDSENNLYLMYGNDAYIPYQVTIQNSDEQEDNNYLIDFEYFEFYDNEYIEFADAYKTKNNITDEQEEEYSDTIREEYIKSKPKKTGKATIKKLQNSEKVTYQLVAIEL